jgi:hypothetical protein
VNPTDQALLLNVLLFALVVLFCVVALSVRSMLHSWRRHEAVNAQRLTFIEDTVRRLEGRQKSAPARESDHATETEGVLPP